MAPAQGDTDTSRTVIVRLAIATHKALRIRVAEEDTSIQKWVESLIERELGVGGARKASHGRSAAADLSARGTTGSSSSGKRKPRERVES